MVQVFNEMQAMFAEIVPGPYLQQQLILVTANVNSCHKALDWCQTVLALNCPLRGHPSTSRIIDSIIALGYRGLLSVQLCPEIGESIKKIIFLTVLHFIDLRLELSDLVFQIADSLVLLVDLAARSCQEFAVLFDLSFQVFDLVVNCQTFYY
jgi:hypothetical protein